MSLEEDGELDELDRAWLERHLRECGNCRTRKAALVDVGTSYRAWLPIAALAAMRPHVLARGGEIVGADWSAAAASGSASGSGGTAAGSGSASGGAPQPLPGSPPTRRWARWRRWRPPRSHSSSPWSSRTARSTPGRPRGPPPRPPRRRVRPPSIGPLRVRGGTPPARPLGSRAARPRLAAPRARSPPPGGQLHRHQARPRAPARLQRLRVMPNHQNRPRLRPGRPGRRRPRRRPPHPRGALPCRRPARPQPGRARPPNRPPAPWGTATGAAPTVVPLGTAASRPPAGAREDAAHLARVGLPAGCCARAGNSWAHRYGYARLRRTRRLRAPAGASARM
jgi:Putative zinc-finger